MTGVVDASSADGDIEARGDAVWVRTGGFFLRRVDPNTPEVVEGLTAPEQSGGEVIVAYDSVWATAYDATCSTASDLTNAQALTRRCTTGS